MIISIAAQKGGVGKSSMSVHLAGVFSEIVGKVLLCDVDPQHSLSATFVDDVFSLNGNMKDMLLDPDTPASDVLQKTKFENIHILPSNLSLGVAEFEFMSDPDSQYLLADKLDELKDDYKHTLIDCPPNLGIFTRLALVASDWVLIPMECSMYGVKSTMFLLELIKKIQSRANPELSILGFVINKMNATRRIEQDYRDMIREQFGDKVFKTELRNSVKYAEAISLKIPINFSEPKSDQAKAYKELAHEMIRFWHPL